MSVENDINLTADEKIRIKALECATRTMQRCSPNSNYKLRRIALAQRYEQYIKTGD